MGLEYPNSFKTFSDRKHKPFGSAQDRLHALGPRGIPKLEQLCQRNRFPLQAIDIIFYL